VVECAFDRSLLQAHFDGEDTPDERNRIQAHLHTCQVCPEFISGAAWEVGLLLLNAPSIGGVALAAPSAGFAGRVRERVRATPRVAPLRLLPPGSGRPPRISWAGGAAAAAAVVVAVAAGLLLLDRREPTPAPADSPTPKGTGSIVATGGGLVRWSGRFDRSLEGSIWTGQDEVAPTLPGEALHSPAPSTVRMRMPEGGRLEAGPLSWLAVGEGDEVALLEGALTAEAAGKPLVVEIPGYRVTVPGEVEVSVRTASAASDSGAPLWLGAWAASRKTDAAPGAAQPVTPGIVAAIYARKGGIEVAGSPGPVRNSLERAGPVRNSLERSGPVRNSLEKVKLGEGQALIVIDGKLYILRSVEENPPGDKGGWLQGLPTPPRSLFFRGRRGGSATFAPPPPPGYSSGPVRNSLERLLGDPAAGVRAKVYALTVYEGTGGAPAVAAAARAATDAAVEVRSTAVRVLALHALSDRATAFAALRTLARDGDEGVARFAILALKTLKDAEAAPLLRAVVADEAAPVVARVYAFDALVSFGDVSLVADAAGLAPKVERDAQLTRALEFAVTSALSLPGAPPARTLITDARPAVRAAALRALKDREACKAALDDSSPLVQIAAAQTLLMRIEPLDLESLRPVFDSGRPIRDRLWFALSFHLSVQRTAAIPAWMVEAARQDVVGEALALSNLEALVKLLARAGEEEFLATLYEGGNRTQKELVLRFGKPVATRVLGALASNEPALRTAAAGRLAEVAALPAEKVTTDALLDALLRFEPASWIEARDITVALGTLAKTRNDPAAMQLLLSMAASPQSHVRRGAGAVLARINDNPEAAAAVKRLLEDADALVAESTLVYAAASASREGWTGLNPASLFPSTSPHAVVRARIAFEAHRAGVAEAREALRRELAEAPSSVRLRFFESIAQSNSLLPDLGPSLLDDPSPAVRLWALLLQEGPASTVAARALSEDPALWVRVTALATLARSEEAASLEALRGLVRLQGSLGETGDRLLRAFDPELPDLASRVLTPARMLASAGESQATADASHANLLEVLAGRGRAERFAASLGAPTDRAAVTTAIRGLGNCSVLEGYAALTSESLLDERSRAEFQDNLLDAFDWLAGFMPGEGPVEFGKRHPRGFVSIHEILSQSGK
jgi:HEAT repeat protein